MPSSGGTPLWRLPRPGPVEAGSVRARSSAAVGIERWASAGRVGGGRRHLHEGAHLLHRAAVGVLDRDGVAVVDDLGVVEQLEAGR